MNGHETENGPRQGGILVIGYGNEMRGDDAAGRKVAERVASWGMENVEALSVRQLTPELAAEMNGRSRVVFVDATLASAPDAGTRITPVAPAAVRESVSHHCVPSGLLALAADINGSVPPASLITVPGERFGLTEGLSLLATNNTRLALNIARQLIGEEPP